MGKEQELAGLKHRAEQEINGIDTSTLDDISEEICEFLEKWNPDGEHSDDPILEAAATLASSIEDLSSDVDYVSDAIQIAADTLSNA